MVDIERDYRKAVTREKKTEKIKQPWEHECDYRCGDCPYQKECKK